MFSASNVGNQFLYLAANRYDMLTIVLVVQMSKLISIEIMFGMLLV